MRCQPVFTRVTIALVLVLLSAPRCTWAFAVHLGCFSLDNGMALSFKAADSTTMTIEACRQAKQQQLLRAIACGSPAR